MRDLIYVRVFTDETGNHGNPLAILPDAAGLSDDEALATARASGTSETVVIDDATSGRVRIYVPNRRVAFAGHPLVGTGWYLWQTGFPVTALLTDAGPVPVRCEGNSCTIHASSGRGVPWSLQELPDVAAVERADSSGAGRHDYVWAWDGQRGACGGHVRARAFTSSSGTVEDEATGSAAVELCAALGRPLVIRQGRGSLIRVAPEQERFLLTGSVAWM